MTLLLHPSLSKVYQGMFTVPSVALQNAMACRVYRLLKLGVISDIPTNVPYSSAFRSASQTHLSTIQFHAIDGNHTGNLDPYAMVGNNAIRITFHDEVVADPEELSDHNAGVGKVEDHPWSECYGKLSVDQFLRINISIFGSFIYNPGTQREC